MTDTPWVKSSSAATAERLTARIASELVRGSSPHRGESSGSTPSSRIRGNKRRVPHVPAARTTWVAGRRRRNRRERLPVRWTSTANDPSGRGRTASTMVIGRTVAPACSAIWRGEDRRAVGQFMALCPYTAAEPIGHDRLAGLT
ncbi:hypothetical protein AB0D34_46920 [Streptomyces sp. NPDC048420]|uniref:hypothetical protein n=1 Tax=Streptomyces sp. NPDC048420 TaxID=3155755 RepID=UPI00343E9590